MLTSGTFEDSYSMTNGNTGYVGMDTSPVQSLDNAAKTNLNKVHTC